MSPGGQATSIGVNTLGQDSEMKRVLADPPCDYSNQPTLCIKCTAPAHPAYYDDLSPRFGSVKPPNDHNRPPHDLIEQLRVRKGEVIRSMLCFRLVESRPEAARPAVPVSAADCKDRGREETFRLFAECYNRACYNNGRGSSLYR